MVEPIVTVIIPTRNRLSLLQEAVTSVQGQTFRDWELIVVDDASEDATWAWLQTVARPCIRLIRLEEHSERSAARNTGLAEARGEFVLFLDDDDRLRPRALERLLAALTRHQDAIAAIGARYYFGDVPREWRPSHPHVTLKRQVWPEVMFGWCPANGEALIHKRIVQSVGAWNRKLTLAEDHELWLRLSQLGPVILSPRVVLENRVHSGQTPREPQPLVEESRRMQLENLSGWRRELGLHVVVARGQWLEGSSSLARGEWSRALSSLLHVSWIAPSLVLSPLTGPYLIGGITRALLGAVCGHGGLSVLRRIKRAVYVGYREQGQRCVAPDHRVNSTRAGFGP